MLPPFDDKNRHIWFVIDGQQRLSVIHQAFEAQTCDNDAGRRIDFGRLCLVVEPDRDENDPARIVYRKPVADQFVPIRDILAVDWKKRTKACKASTRHEVRKCRARLLNYMVPTVTIQSASLEEIGEVFIRVNSQGMRITSADRAIALMGKLDVRAMAQELRQKVRAKHFAIGGIDSILMGFNLVTDRPETDGDPPKLDAMAQRWSKRIEKSDGERKKFQRLWNKYQHAFSSAVDYLRERCLVRDESFLPSANMLATLAIFFYNHAGQPSSYQAAEIKKWFWATGVGQRYSGRGYHHNIVADAIFFEKLALGMKKRFAFPDLLDPVLDLQSAEYSSRSARTRAFFCLLASRKPCYLENGEPISLDTGVISHASRKHRHHVFPQAQLKSHVSARVYNSLCNICFLVARDNMKIGMSLPRRYLAGYRTDGPKRFHRVMKSHLLPVGPEAGVWDKRLLRAFKQFRRERLAMICSAFEKAAGIKLFRRAPD